MKNLFVVMLVVVAVALGVVIARTRPPADQEAVEYRQALMTVIGGQMQSLSAMQQGRRSYDAGLVSQHAGNLAALGRMIPEAFARDTSGSRAQQSAALPQVWNEHAAFLTSAARMVVDAAALQNSVAGGDGAQVMRAAGTLSGECAQCHRVFRAN